MKRIKKFVFLSLSIALLVAPTTSAFADSSMIVSEEGIGINIYNPIMNDENFSMFNQSSKSTIEGDKVSVSGGTLWATWRNGVDFRANYDHSTKEHRSSSMNANGKPLRSSWVSKGIRAISPWNYQTLYGNKVFGATI
ncbi:MAG: hypothetical protein R3Y64_08910 [Peptostreptococcaceae bacterium]